MNRLKKFRRIPQSPYLILLGGFAVLILLGTLLLLLPFSTNEGMNIDFVDSLFLATSAVCVTGLVSTPLPISELFTPFGYGVLWFLIEVGGLGFITLVTFAFSFRRKKIGVSTNVLLKEAMNQNSYHELMPLAKKIVITSFSIQAVGFVLNLIAFLISGSDFMTAVGYSFFHTASSFNNAGFDIFGNTSLMAYKDNGLLMATTATLVVLGGLGFVVMFDIVDKKKYRRLSVHSRIVLKTTLLILVVGTIFLKLTAWQELTWSDSILQVIFARTAGFYTAPISGLQNTSIILLLMIMFVGGSPASIAGGVKTTTLYTIIKSILGFGRGRKHVISHNREIKDDSILKSYVLVTVSFMFIIIMAFCISVCDPNFTLKEIIFEAVSAFGTVGTSLDVTPLLSSGSKLFIVLLMYFGRLGPITFISLLNKGVAIEDQSIRYVEEKIIIG